MKVCQTIGDLRALVEDFEMNGFSRCADRTGLNRRFLVGKIEAFGQVMLLHEDPLLQLVVASES